MLRDETASDLEVLLTHASAIRMHACSWPSSPLSMVAPGSERVTGAHTDEVLSPFFVLIIIPRKRK